MILSIVNRRLSCYNKITAGYTHRIVLYRRKLSVGVMK